MKKYLTNLLILIICLPSLADTDKCSVRHLGVERGLSNNHVVSITQDKNGFIWIATDEGLNRFDGHTFKKYYKEETANANGLSGNELNSIIDDPHRPVLWIATQRSGLNSYDYSRDEFRNYRHDDNDPQSLVTNDVTALAPSAAGGLWVGTYWRGVDHLDPESGKFTHYNAGNIKGLPSGPVLDILDGGDGFLYLAHERHGLSIIDLKRKTAVNYLPGGKTGGLPGDNINRIFKDGSNNIWLGTRTGLVLFNRDEGTFTNFGDTHSALRHSVSDIRQFDEHRLWVAMERGGIAVLELNDSIFSNPAQATCTTLGTGVAEPHLTSQSVRALFRDSYSNIWAGTWGGGLNLISGNMPAFRIHPATPVSLHGEILSANTVMTALFDNDHRLWIGRDGGGIDVIDGDKVVAAYKDGRNGLPGDIVQASHKSADGTLWFGMFFNGACRYNPSTGTFTQIFTSNPREDVRDICSDPQGNIVFGTSRGIWRYSQRDNRLTGPISIGNNLVRKVFTFGNNRFLVGTFGDGMYLTDADFRPLRHFSVETGIPSNTVDDIFCSRDGHVWVATGEGLLDYADLLKPDSGFKLYNRASGLNNAHVQAIAQDRSGGIWVSTNGGISCILGDKVYNYEIRDNVPMGNFMSRCAATDQQGNMYFGALGGLCVFNPVKVLEKVPVPTPVITEISVMEPSGSEPATGKHIQVAGKHEVSLSAGQNSFYISYMITNLSLADEVEYAYMLEGLDNVWMESRAGNYTTFRELPPGKYTFKVKARIRNQEWGETAELEIIVSPPFYLSWWAKTIYVLTALGIMAAALLSYRRSINAKALLKADKKRLQQEQILNDERLHFYTNITHELRTPLTLIMGPLEDLSKDAQLPEREHNSLLMVHRNATRLLDLVNRLLEFRKTETHHRRLVVRRGNIAATVFEVSLKYKELNRNSKVKVNVTAEPATIEALFDKEVMVVILDNLISNALKYTSEGHIDIDCRENNGFIEISVRDTGKGMPAAVIPKIFDRFYQVGESQAAGTGIGLALVKNLVTLHHGVIAVSSREGEGTEFSVTFDMRDQYPEAMHLEAEHVAEEETSGTDQPGKRTDSIRKKPVLLLVEDNDDIRDYVKQAFTDLYEVHTAENGRVGLDKAFDIMPNVIVSDIMMPELDGIEMLRRLKKDVRTSHIPVIMLTAKETNADRELGYITGADSYLTKPFSSSLLQARINNLLMQRIKLTEAFSARPAETSSQSTGTPPPDNSLEEKKAILKKSLSEIDKEFIDKLSRTITDNIPQENVDVNFLAGVFCMSSSTLYRKVKALTGLSPNEYIRKTKMHIAEQLLLAGRYTFSEISYKVGMNSNAYFRNCFKEEFGMTPTEYLKKVNS